VWSYPTLARSHGTIKPEFTPDFSRRRPFGLLEF
jgi:hypothetical protein